MDPVIAAGKLSRISLLALLAAPAAVRGQELITDRPDATESAEVVPPGMVQIEIGSTYSRDEEIDTVETIDSPAALVRIGLTDRLELRLGASLVEQTVDPGGRVSGLADGELGAKLVLARESGNRPQLALLAATSVPIGDDRLTTDELDPSFRLALAHTLPRGLGLGYNVGMEWESVKTDTGETTTLANAIYAIALGIPLSERTGLFVELFGDVPASASGSAAHSFDAGLTWLTRPNVQLDIAAGVGISEAAEDWFVGIGLSIRFPR